MALTDPLDEYILSYQEFYAEIPGTTDYLNDIDTAIYDEHEADTDGTRGLTSEQVSEIARDSMGNSQSLHQIPTSGQASLDLIPNDTELL
jgi:hypothetical protein